MAVSTDFQTRLVLQNSLEEIEKSPSITPRQSWTKSSQSERLSNFDTVSNLRENLVNPPTSLPPPIPLPRTKFLSLPSEVVSITSITEKQLKKVKESRQKDLRRSEGLLTATEVESLSIKLDDKEKIKKFSPEILLQTVQERSTRQAEDEADIEGDGENNTWL